MKNLEKVLQIMQQYPARCRVGQQLAENIVLDGTYDQILEEQGEEAAAIVEEWLNLQAVYFDDTLPVDDQAHNDVLDPKTEPVANNVQSSLWSKFKTIAKKINAINLKEIAQAETTVFVSDELYTILKTRHETRHSQNATRHSPAIVKKRPAARPP